MEGLCDVLPGSVMFGVFAFAYSLPPLKKKASESRNRQLGYDGEREVVEGQRLW